MDDDVLRIGLLNFFLDSEGIGRVLESDSYLSVTLTRVYFFKFGFWKQHSPVWVECFGIDDASNNEWMPRTLVGKKSNFAVESRSLSVGRSSDECVCNRKSKDDALRIWLVREEASVDNLKRKLTDLTLFFWIDAKNEIGG